MISESHLCPQTTSEAAPEEVQVAPKLRFHISCTIRWPSGAVGEEREKVEDAYDVVIEGIKGHKVNLAA